MRERREERGDFFCWLSQFGPVYLPYTILLLPIEKPLHPRDHSTTYSLPPSRPSANLLFTYRLYNLLLIFSSILFYRLPVAQSTSKVVSLTFNLQRPLKRRPVNGCAVLLFSAFLYLLLLLSLQWVSLKASNSSRSSRRPLLYSFTLFSSTSWPCPACQCCFCSLTHRPSAPEAVPLPLDSLMN